jgi:phytoene/squalene synthetase
MNHEVLFRHKFLKKGRTISLNTNFGSNAASGNSGQTSEFRMLNKDSTEIRKQESDLSKNKYDDNGYKEYIYGSAEVVGLMCLYVFCEGNKEQYQQLKPYAQALGAAFQKVNFLRDMKADAENLKRVYFPGVDFSNFTSASKRQIEADIQADFIKAYEGILLLPVKARFGVYVAYKYYLSLFNRIKKSQPSTLLQDRIRIPNYSKVLIVMRAGVRSQLNIM